MFKKLQAFLLLLVGAYTGSAQPATDALLRQADSLFAAQQFTQSFALYDSLYRHYNRISPAMLLKMAYIKEGLGDITLAEYYLNEYYLATHNDLAMQKMAKLADEYQLEGYEQNDLTFFFNLYYKNYDWLVLTMLAICLTLLAVVVYQKVKHRSVSVSAVIILLLFTAGLFLLVNFGRAYNRGVIVKNNTFIMAAPSAGADVLDVTGKGHKVIIKGREDVWYKIIWKDRTGYVKNTQVDLLKVW